FQTTIAQPIVGTGGLTITDSSGTNAGIVILAGDSTYSGATDVEAGVLQAGAPNVLSPNSDVNVASGATLDLDGFNQTVPGLTNAGLVNMGTGTPPGTRLTVAGDYLGQGGTIAMDTFLGSDGSASDRLVLNGGTASGNTNLAIANANGPGLKTNGNGIELVEADNAATTAPGAFQLAGPVAAGAYQYFLYRGGPNAAGSAGDGGSVAQNWYLRSDLIPTPPPVTPPPVTPPPGGPSANPPPVTPPPAAGPTYPNYRPEVPVYLAMSEMASGMGFATIDNLLARQGDEFEDPARPLVPTVWCKNPDRNYRCPLPNTKGPQDEQADLIQRYGMWSRVIAFTGGQLPGDRSLSASNTFLQGKGPSYDYTMAGFQAGMTFLRRDASDGSRDRAGFYVGDTQMWGNVAQVYSGIYTNGRAGTVDLNGVNFGAYWTHYFPFGLYSDSVVQGTWYDRAQGYGNLSSLGVGGFGFAASEELGDPIQLAHGFVLEPQAQAIYEHTHLDGGTDAYGTTSFGATDDIRARIGARLATSTSLSTASGTLIPLSVWGRFNVWHDFLLNRPSATFSALSLTDPTTIDGALQGTWGEVDAGASAQLTRTISVFGSAVYDHSIDAARSWAVGGRVGVKFAW
ncbi:MAG TPA: autotransporter outer membrane beta-barrel domain-containing protein, partial [Mycobacterium sp.]